MVVTTDEELQALRRIGRIVALTLQSMLERARPGMPTEELDAFGESLLRKQGARSAPKLVYDFPGATCISINEEAAHGIPGSRVMKAGDMVNVDVSAELDGFFADAGASVALAPVSARSMRLVTAAKQARDNAIAQVRAGKSFVAVADAVERVARKAQCGVLRNLGSHGVGRGLHEDPEFIPAYRDRNERRVFRDGQVITIEPFLTTGPTHADDGGDGWSLVLPPGHRVAQFEHTLVVTKGEPVIITAP